jgi:uncharacterized cupredoxin-like copper-binding protein
MMQRPTAALLLLLAAACSPSGDRQPDQPSIPAAVAPPVVTFIATDFAFQGPDTIAPGFTTIRMVNQGPQEHHLILARLSDGYTLDSLMAFMQKDPAGVPPFATWRGAANVVLDGDSTGSTVDLPAGRYALLCFIPDPADGAPHAVKGMTRELIVAGTPTGATGPTASGELRLKDLGYTMPAWVAGTQTIHVVNDGPQIHEAQLFRLDAGKTAKDYIATAAPGYKGPKAGAPVGGSGALSPGLDNYWTVTLAPGTYLLMCYVPGADGTPHIMQGMVQEFTVPAPAAPTAS